MISVRSPWIWSSSSGVGGNGRFGGPPAPCGGVELLGGSDGGDDVEFVADAPVAAAAVAAAAAAASSDSTLRPGLYENSGLTKTKSKKHKMCPPKQTNNKKIGTEQERFEKKNYWKKKRREENKWILILIILKFVVNESWCEVKLRVSFRRKLVGRSSFVRHFLANWLFLKEFERKKTGWL